MYALGPALGLVRARFCNDRFQISPARRVNRTASLFWGPNARCFSLNSNRDPRSRRIYRVAETPRRAKTAAIKTTLGSR